MKRTALIILVWLVLGGTISSLVAATTDSSIFKIIALRGQIATLTAENTDLKTKLGIVTARCDAAEQWNAKILLWFNFGGTFPKKPPIIAMEYCQDQGPTALPECWFCDLNRDGRVNDEDMTLWEVAK